MTKVTKQQVEEAMRNFEEPCKMMIEHAKQDKATKNGYGTMLATVSRLKKSEQGIALCALVYHGYPQETADVIASQDTFVWNVYNSFLSILRSPAENAR